MKRILVFAVCHFLATSGFAGGPYPAVSGLSATIDDAAVAGLNPAGMTYFDRKSSRFEVLGFFSESTWEGRLDESSPTVSIDDDSSLVVPVAAVVIPFRKNWWFGFTIQGVGFTEEYDDDWPGRYFLQEYEQISISAYPSIATRLSDKLSVALSLPLTYTSFDQRKAVPNIDPGYNDGSLQIDTDGLSVGFGLSMMYDISPRTRFGAVYRSAQDPELDGNAKFSDLGPITEAILDNAGLIGANVDVTSKLPQSVTAGISHDFENDHSMTFDVIWSGFSEFILAEVYVNGDQIIANEQEYEDILAMSASYSWPIKDRWRLGIGGFYVSDMLKDDNRTVALRLDSVWSLGAGVEWKWKENRTVTASLNFLKSGDAPVSTPELPGFGSVAGEFTERHTIYFRVALSFAGRPG